jgi:CRP-like cAMP-binding protein
VYTKLLIQKLEAIGDLTTADRGALRDFGGTVIDVAAARDIVAKGERPTTTTLVLSGLVARYKLLGDGRRQLLSFYIPGDMPDLQSLYLDVMDHSLAALVPTQILSISHQIVKAILTKNPSLNHLFWREMLIDAAVLRERGLRLGIRLILSRRFSHSIVRKWARLDFRPEV